MIMLSKRRLTQSRRAAEMLGDFLCGFANLRETPFAEPVVLDKLSGRCSISRPTNSSF
jgi:hypothetical protein